jgi:hypothetical protein
MLTFESVHRSDVCRMIGACIWVLGCAQMSDASAQHRACPKISDPAAIIGTVVSAQGNWCDRSCESCPLSKMYPVTAASQLIPARATVEPLTVTIRSRWGAKEIFDCSNPRELGCKRPLDLSRLVVQEQPRNVLGAFWDAITELAADRPKVYDSFRQGILSSRGSEQQRLSDDVAELTPQGLKVENILSLLPAGKYLLELCPLNDGGDAVCPDESIPVEYSWNPKEPAPYPASNARPGMYRLYQYDSSNGTPRRSRHYAAVLVSDEKKYSTLASDFHQVIEATRTWDTDDPTAPALRRAYLYSLSRR